MNYSFYINKGSDPTSQGPDLPECYTAKIWRPTGLQIVPEGGQNMKNLFGVWWLFHKLRIFQNMDYCACLIYHKQLLAHYSIVLPPFFKVRFMDRHDLQIGPTGTHEEHRRLGLASVAINMILSVHTHVARTFWYITRDVNVPSIKTCERAGFVKYAEGNRRPNFGLSFLANFEITKVLEEHGINSGGHEDVSAS